MNFIRSLIHMVWMTVTVIPWALAVVVASLFIRGDRLYWMCANWLAVAMWGCRVICGVQHRLHGMENLPTRADSLATHMLLAEEDVPVRLELPGVTLAQKDGKWTRSTDTTEKSSQDDLTRWAEEWRFASSLATQPFDHRRLVLGQHLRLNLIDSQARGDRSATNASSRNIGQPIDAQTTATGLPTISPQPVAQSAAVGGSATFTVGATSTTDTAFTYQWLKNGVPIAGATRTSYSIAVATAADAGDKP